MSTYKFVKTFDEPIEQDNTQLSFIQVASFPNPKTNLYHVRRFIVNQNNEIIGIKEYFLSKKRYDRLLQRKKRNQYKLYSVYNLNVVNYPCASDILMLKSNILGSDYNYSGFAPF
jgi:hypothetical protein